MVTKENIRAAMLKGGIPWDALRDIPDDDIELIRKALPADASEDADELAGCLFSEEFKAAIADEDEGRMSEAAGEYFAKAMGKDEGDEEDDDEGDEKKAKSLAEDLFGEGADDDEEDDEDDGEEDDDEDDAYEGPVKKGYDFADIDADEEGYVDLEDILEPFQKALDDRDERLDSMDAKLDKAISGLATLTKVLEGMAPFQKAVQQFVGDQARPAGRAPAMVANQRSPIEDLDISEDEFENTLQKALSMNVATAGMTGTLREVWGTPQFAIHETAFRSLQKQIKDREAQQKQ